MSKIGIAIERIKKKIKEVREDNEYPVNYIDREGNQKVLMDIGHEIGYQIIGLEQALEILEKVRDASQI